MPDDLGALQVAERLLKVCAKISGTVVQRLRRDLYATSRQRLNKEIRIWMALRHPNIAPLIGFTFSGEVCVISPWFSNGNVGEYLQRNPDTDRLRLVRLFYPCLVHRPNADANRSGKSRRVLRISTTENPLSSMAI